MKESLLDIFMEIRELEKKDIPELNKLLNSIVEEGIYFARNKKRTLKEEKNLFENYLRKKNRKLMFVCLKNNKIVGFSSATRKQGKRDHVWEISYCIKKEYRKMGLGSALLSKLLDHLGDRNAEQIIAWVIEINKPSINLLNKYGFEETGRIKNGIKIGENYCDYILFQKRNIFAKSTKKTSPRTKK